MKIGLTCEKCNSSDFTFVPESKVQDTVAGFECHQCGKGFFRTDELPAFLKESSQLIIDRSLLIFTIEAIAATEKFRNAN